MRNEQPGRLLWGVVFVVFALALAPSVEAGGRGPRPGTIKTVKSWGQFPSLGNPKAKVVIEVFGGFQCPWTRRLAPLLPKIAKAYPKKVKIVWRDFVIRFHKRGMPAAIAAREVFRQVGPKGFMIIATKMFTNFRSLTDQNLVSWAGLAGADKTKVGQALRTSKYELAIKKEMKQAQGRGVRGTPTILVNGVPYKGARTLSAFRKTIDAL
jgi:protein-disulfide isomerase